MEITTAQNDAIYNQVRNYYQHFANDLGIVNPPSDLVQFGDVLVQAIRNLGLGVRLPGLARRITHAPLPSTRNWNMSSLVDRSIIKYLQELGIAIDPSQSEFYRTTTNADLLAKHIDDYIAALKRTPISSPHLKPISLPRSPSSFRRDSVAIVKPTSPRPIPISIPRIPMGPSPRMTSRMARPNSPIDLDATSRAMYNAEPLPDIASRLAARSDEVAKILGITDEQFLASIYRYLPRNT